MLILHPLNVGCVAYKLHLRVAWILFEPFLIMLDCPIGVAFSRLAAGIGGDK
jgi:hypothetical protein